MKDIFLPISLMAALLVNVSVTGLSKLVIAGEATQKAVYTSTGINAHKNFYTPKDIIHFLNSNASRLSRRDKDRYLLQLISLQKNYQKVYEKKLYSDKFNTKINQYNYQELIALRNIKDADIKELLQKIRDNGFKLSTSEGMVYIEIDYPRLAKEFGRSFSPEVTGYLRINAKETLRHFSEDAGLMISPDQLAGRLVAIEAYCKKYPRFSRINDVKRLYEMYLSAYLIGMNNTPAFSYKNGRLEEQFLKSYNNSIKLYKGTEFAGLIRDYLKILTENGFKKTKVILDFVANSPSKTLLP